MSEKDTKRVTLDLSPGAYNRLQRLKGRIEASNGADVLRKALQLLEYIADCLEKGDTFVARSVDGRERDIVFVVPTAGDDSESLLSGLEIPKTRETLVRSGFEGCARGGRYRL